MPPNPGDPFLPFKAAALIAGIVLILLSARLGIPALGWIAIGLLAVAFALRFLRRKPPSEGNGDAEGG
jgi:hypothetical protein